MPVMDGIESSMNIMKIIREETLPIFRSICYQPKVKVEESKEEN